MSLLHSNHSFVILNVIGMYLECNYIIELYVYIIEKKLMIKLKNNN